MDERQIARAIALESIYREAVLPFVGEVHVDFGCGEGWSANYIAHYSRDNRVIGFDPDGKKIELARKRFQLSGAYFTDELESLRRLQISSISSEFVLHEAGDRILDVCHSFIPGIVVIVDYDMKGLRKPDFFRLFDFEREQKALREEGIEPAFAKHTKFGLCDCIREAEIRGFRTLRSQGKIADKYFYWIGKAA